MNYLPWLKLIGNTVLKAFALDLHGGDHQRFSHKVSRVTNTLARSETEVEKHQGNCHFNHVSVIFMYLGLKQKTAILIMHDKCDFYVLQQLVDTCKISLKEN